MPAHLAERTVRSALSITMGGQTAATLASASVIALSRGALRAMLFTKLKLFAVSLLTVLGMDGWGRNPRECRSSRLGADVQSSIRAARCFQPPWKTSGDHRLVNADGDRQ